MPSDSKVLILSQDYELFFSQSGSIEKCLFEPCAALLEFAEKRSIRITFYVDIGMILCMERFAPKHRKLQRYLDQTKSHIASLVGRGHEVALHIHPHWEDTRWVEDAWDFSNTRYQLAFFSPEETRSIVQKYAEKLAEISGIPAQSYRAGGFCVEPFELLRPALRDAGILIDSSVVSGAFLKDRDKGFDFRGAPDDSWWHFDKSPSVPGPNGEFLEIPITPQTVPFYFYWGRLLVRMLRQSTSDQFGDGLSKAIGRKEVVRRLLGQSLVAELSVDDAKAPYLMSEKVLADRRDAWHVMGHPKLASVAALETLDRFIAAQGINNFETVNSFASAIRGT